MASESWAVLWDVDGTLVDTAELHFQAWIALAARTGQTVHAADFAATFGWRNPEIIPKLFGSECSDARNRQLGDHKEDLYRTEAEKGVAVCPAWRHCSQRSPTRAACRRSARARRRNLELILRLTGTERSFRRRRRHGRHPARQARSRRYS